MAFQAPCQHELTGNYVSLHWNFQENKSACLSTDGLSSRVGVCPWPNQWHLGTESPSQNTTMAFLRCWVLAGEVFLGMKHERTEMAKISLFQLHLWRHFISNTTDSIFSVNSRHILALILPRAHVLKMVLLRYNSPI